MQGVPLYPSEEGVRFDLFGAVGVNMLAGMANGGERRAMAESIGTEFVEAIET